MRSHYLLYISYKAIVVLEQSKQGAVVHAQEEEMPTLHAEAISFAMSP